MTVDPRLNCAAGICCGGGGGAAMTATVSILRDLGCPEEHATQLAFAMRGKGIVFTSQALADAIAEIVDHPNRRSAKEEGT